MPLPMVEERVKQRGECRECGEAIPWNEQIFRRSNRSGHRSAKILNRKRFTLCAKCTAHRFPTVRVVR